MEKAIEFKTVCEKLGWTYQVTGNIVKIFKKFEAGNVDQFVECDMEYYFILSLAPLKGGSIWGTDGGGIGAIAAMKTGVFQMNKSGNGKRFLNALAKL